MKFKDLKIGMKIKATSNDYLWTAKSRKWVGLVCAIHHDGTFSAKTESSITMHDKNTVYNDLLPEYFEEVGN